ncbi:uncharacterized protein LOC118411052 [Branchiostoma floridae]|uniref:Uncharacterized protein LOC118411052 n=1 Tax=Branchiostoma floridae TaxID=7739 RepID=A0A9J7KR59_BRAFL|nr:uncharacterized protein LOC118411052 [Branchiostoma floridae]
MAQVRTDRDGGQLPTPSDGAAPVHPTDRPEEKRKLLRTYIYPMTNASRVWEAIIAITCVATACIGTFKVSFESRHTELWVLTYIFDALYLSDIVLQFFYVYFDYGVPVTDLKLIRRRYMRRTFAVDLLSLLPIELIAFGVPGESFWKMMALFQLNRLLRMYRVQTFFDILEMELGLKTEYIRTMKYTAVSWLCLHLMACGWFALGCTGKHWGMQEECEHETWTEPNERADILFPNNDTGYEYVISMYWATATSTSTGYGDIHAKSLSEKAYSIAAMLAGVAVFFGMILGGMTSMLTNMDSQRAQFTHRLDTIKQYLIEEDIPETQQRQIIKYYKYFWTVVSKDGTPLATFKHGKVFGELSLIFNVPRTASIRAATNCDLIVLEKKDLHIILNHYPDVMKRLHEMAVQRFGSPDSPLYGLTDVGTEGMFGHLASGTSEDAQGAEAVSSAVSTRRASALRRLSLRKPSTDPMTGHRDSIDEDPATRGSFFAAVKEKEDSTGEGARAGSRPLAEARRASRGASRKSIKLSESVEILNAQLAPSVEEGAICAWFRLKCLVVVEWLASHVLDPTSIFCRGWEIFIIITTFAVCMSHSYLAAFYVTRAGANPVWALGSSGFIVSYLLDVPLLLDVVIRLRTGIFTPNGILTDWDSIRTHYVRSWSFVLDLCSILPIELFALASPHLGTVRLGLVACLKLNRLIKFHKLTTFFSKMEESLTKDIFVTRSLKLFTYIILIIHWCSCLLYAQSCPGFGTDPQEWCVEGGWVDHLGLAGKEISMHHYFVSLYFTAATMTSTGYGDIVPSTTTGRVLAMAVMIVGLLLCGYCVSDIAATLSNMDAARVDFQAKLSVVRQFMKDHEICPNLRRRVVNYMILMWGKLRGEEVAGSMGLMHDMPVALQQDVAFEEAKEVLEQVPLFQETDPSFLRELAVNTHAVLYAPGDVIVYSGDITRDLHMIRKGYCEILTDDLAETLCIMGPGQYFGQLSLLFGDQQPDTIRSRTYVELIILTRDDLEDVLSKYPLVEKQFHELSKMEDFREALRLSKIGTEGPTKPRIRSFSQVAATADDDQLESLYLPSLHRKKSEPVFKFPSDGLGGDKDYLEPFHRLSTPLRILSNLLMRRTFMTSGRWFRVWIGLRLLMAAASTFTYTLQAALLRESWALFGINIGLDVCNFVDMYIKLHAAFYNDKHVMVTHPLETARHYLKTNFLMDIMASFPIELVAIPFITNWDYTDLMALVGLLRLNRVLIAYNLLLFFDYLESNVEIETGLIRQVKFFLYSLIFTHWTTCVVWLMGCPPFLSTPCVEDNWIARTLVDEHDFKEDEHGKMYATSMYWACATALNVGYGDLHASLDKDYEMVLMALLQIVGIVFYGYIVASVAASLANAAAQRARYQERLRLIFAFLKCYGVDERLQKRVDQHYEYLWVRTRGIATRSLFEGLPVALEADVTFTLYQRIIEKVPIFYGMDVGFEKMVSLYFKPTFVLEGELIVRKNDIPTEMFYVLRGAVERVSPDEDDFTGRAVCAAGPGSFFGYMHVMLKEPWEFTVRAKSNCDLYILTRADLLDVLCHYPSLHTQVIDRTEVIRKETGKEESWDYVYSEQAEFQDTQENQSDVQVNPTDKTGDVAVDIEPMEYEVAVSVSRPILLRPFARIWGRLRRWNRFVIDCRGLGARLYWHLSTFVLIGSLWLLSWEAAFQSHNWEILLLTYLCDAFFLIEIWLKFHMSYIDEHGNVEADFDRIFTHYFYNKNGLLVDVIAALPVDIFALAADTHQRLIVLSLLRLWHLLRGVRVVQYFNKLSTDLRVNVLMARLYQSLVEVLLVIHLLSCFFYIAACPLGKCQKNTWVHDMQMHAGGEHGEEEEEHHDEEEEEEDEDHEEEEEEHHEEGGPVVVPPSLQAYVSTVYWTVATLTSTGYGDIHAFSPAEMICAAVVMVFGKMMFGLVLGNIASTLSNTEAFKVSFEEKLKATKAHMEDQAVPNDLRQKVVHYYDYIWLRNRGVDVSTLFQEAPRCLQEDISYGMTKTYLNGSSLFRGLPESFLKTLSTRLRLLFFLPGNYVLHRGDMGAEMYIIFRGEVESGYDKSDGEFVAETVMGEGKVIGEMSLTYSLPRRRSVRARRHTDIFALNRRDLLDLLEDFLAVREEIEQRSVLLFAHLGAPRHKDKDRRSDSLSARRSGTSQSSLTTDREQLVSRPRSPGVHAKHVLDMVLGI